jgi:origin recognition complex subunit 5
MGMVEEIEAGSATKDQRGDTLSQELLIRKHLGELFLGRMAEIGDLLTILGEPGDLFPPLLLYGSAATGKTSVVKEPLMLLDRPFTYVSCRSCHNPRLVFKFV